MRNLFYWSSVALMISGAAFAACSDETVNPVGQGGGGSTGVGGQGGEEPTPPGEPQALDVPQWMVARVNANDDQILGAIEQGTMDLPPEGAYLGTFWEPVVPGAENHELIEAFTDLEYAVARVQAPEGHRVFARGDTVVGFYVDNAVRQPGDFYHSRKIRSPLGCASECLIVVRALGRRNVPEVQLWSTDAELVFNQQDMTLPDLVVGSDAPSYVGIATLHLQEEAATEVSAHVVESDAFEATEVVYPGLAANSTTQLSFLLQPKAPFETPDEMVDVTLRIDSPTLDWSYDTTIEIPTVAADARRRVTRRSNVDHSTQYYSLMPPAMEQPGQDYGLILSLHGASVEASGQAAAYSPKEWAYLIAPTNRRPFGFDWEEWGRLDALEALDHAVAVLPVDETRVHLTGHSMGGHGSWHVGVHFAHRFGVVAPSAGWISFEQYGGGPHASGSIGRARAASLTLDFVENLAASSVYIVHGSADDNVPVSHAQQMFSTLQPITPELEYHEEAGAGHWWDADQDEPGADCVDWEPMISVMEQRQVDLWPLDFRFIGAAPWVSPTRSYVTVLSVDTPMENFVVESLASVDQIDLITTNVRSMTLDGDALLAAGINSVTIDGGQPQNVTAGPMPIGPRDGKLPAQSGPLNQLYQSPFCLVWPDAGPDAYRDYAAFLLSWWSVIGNGHGCGMSLSALTDQVRADYNIIFLGIAPEDVGIDAPLDWSDSQISAGSQSWSDAAMGLIYPDGDGLAGFFATTAGYEYLLFRYMPFSSRSGMPDFLVWRPDGLGAAGFFDASWQLEPNFSDGL